jgi:glycosyltransferase involved in cell wall biosynthesis
MRILVIRNSTIVGGAELYYVKLADAFKAYHIDCKIILVTNNIALTRLAKSHNIEAHRVNAFAEEVGTKRGLARLALNLPNYLRKYYKIFQKLTANAKPDIVVFSGRTEKIVLTPLLRLAGFHVLWLEHGRAFTKTMSKVVLVIYKFVSIFATKILAEARDTEKNLINNGINPKKVTYLGSGIDINAFPFKRQRRKKKFIVGYMASINIEKGIWEYLQVALIVCRKNKDIKFLVLGAGPDLQMAKSYVKQNKLDTRVVFVGYQKNPKKYLAQMSVFLSPINHLGGLSLSVETAMAIGVVPIVTNIGGNRELVKNRITGYIFSNFYTKNASKTILKLYKNQGLLKRISILARKHILDNFTAKKLADKWYSIVCDNIN